MEEFIKVGDILYSWEEESHQLKEFRVVKLETDEYSSNRMYVDFVGVVLDPDTPEEYQTTYSVWYYVNNPKTYLGTFDDFWYLTHLYTNKADCLDGRYLTIQKEINKTSKKLSSLTELLNDIT